MNVRGATKCYACGWRATKCWAKCLIIDDEGGNGEFIFKTSQATISKAVASVCWKRARSIPKYFAYGSVSRQPRSNDWNGVTGVILYKTSQNANFS